MQYTLGPSNGRAERPALPSDAIGHVREIRFEFGPVRARRGPQSGLAFRFAPEHNLLTEDAISPGFFSISAFLYEQLRDKLDPDGLSRALGAAYFNLLDVPKDGVVQIGVCGNGPDLEFRNVARAAIETEVTAFGHAHILFETSDVGLYILEVSPGSEIPAHYHLVMNERELILDEGLHLQGANIRSGDAFLWQPGQVHHYENPTALAKRILCIDAPKFIPEDEVVVDPPPSRSRVAPFWNYLECWHAREINVHYRCM